MNLLNKPSKFWMTYLNFFAPPFWQFFIFKPLKKRDNFVGFIIEKVQITAAVDNLFLRRRRSRVTQKVFNFFLQKFYCVFLTYVQINSYNFKIIDAFGILIPDNRLFVTFTLGVPLKYYFQLWAFLSLFSLITQWQCLLIV